VQFQTGIIASTIINTIAAFAGSKKDPIDPISYIPRFSSKTSSHPSASQELTEEEKLNNSLTYIRELTRAFGGVDVTQLPRDIEPATNGFHVEDG